MVREFRKRRDFIYSTLRNMGLNSVKPESAFYIFPEVPYNCLVFSEKLVSYGVAVTPGYLLGRE